MPKHLSIDNALDGNLKPVKDSDGTPCALEISTDKARVKSLEISGEAKGQTPTTGDGLATKQYVDDNAGGSSNYYWNINSGFNYSSTAGTKVYAPLNGYIIESSSATGRNEYQVVAMPHDGYLSKVIVRSEEACGSTIVGLHISGDNVEIPNATASHTVTVDMAADDIGYNFAFGESASFSSGQVIAISLDPTNDANDTILTAVFILDGST
tara:strand:- start:1871 stop:2503 length:633 start_codon:yes stop_codon:yes gene_type:complete